MTDARYAAFCNINTVPPTVSVQYIPPAPPPPRPDMLWLCLNGVRQAGYPGISGSFDNLIPGATYTFGLYTADDVLIRQTAPFTVPALPGAGTPVPTPTPAPTPTPTPAPAPSNGPIAPDGTLTGLPSTIAAGQPLSAATYGQSTLYFGLYRVAGAVEEGLRWGSNVMPGNLNLLIPQTAGAYTVRGYGAATGGSLTYESAQFTVTALPGALPATPTQAADTGTTSSGTTMNWSATATSYRVLARLGVGSVYGSLTDATVTANSYSFTGLAPNSTPRAVIIPRNANGYGTPSGQFLSSTSAAAAPSNSFPLTFAGAAGAPTGTRTLTAWNGSDVSTAALDGGGNLTMPTANYQYGTLQGAGTVAVPATVTATFKAGGAGALALGRVDASGQNGAFVVVRGGTGTLVFVTRSDGTDAITSGPSVTITGRNSFGVRMAANGTWYPQIDGADVAGASFVPTAVATGYVLIGSGDAGGTAISQITVQ